MTVATLGLTVDSSQVSKATAELDKLTGAANRTAPAVDGLSTGAKRLTPAVDGLATGTKRLTPAVDGLTKSTGLARHELINLSRQVQDVGVSLVSGQSAFTVLAQQGTQVADIFATSSGSVRGFGGQLARAATSTVGLTGLVGAASIGLLAFSSHVVSSERELSNLAERAGIATDRLRGLQSAASIKGVSGEDFTSSMSRLGDLTSQAKLGLGQLAELFRLNGQRAGDVVDNVSALARIMANARDESQRYKILQELGLPATREMVKFWSQGADAIKKAADEATKFNEGAASGLVKKSREAEEAWNRFWTHFSENARAAGVIGLGAVASVFDAADKRAKGGVSFASPAKWRNATPLMGEEDAARFYDAIGPLSTGKQWSNGKSTTGNENAALIAQEQQRISLLGELASVSDRVRLKQLELNAASASGAGLTRQQRDAVLKYTEAQALGLTQIQSLTDSLHTESDSYGMATGKAAEFRAVQERLAEFRRLGITLTEKQVAAIRREAAALGEATTAAERLKIVRDDAYDRSLIGLSDTDVQIAQRLRGLYGDDIPAALASTEAASMRVTGAMREFNDISKNAVTSLVDGLIDGQKATDALAGSLRSMAKSLANSAVNSLWGSLFKSADGNAFESGRIVPHALGGIVTGPTFRPMANGDTALMGEAGPEGVLPLKRAPDGKLGVIAMGGGGANASVTMGDFHISVQGGATGQETAQQIKIALMEFVRTGLKPQVIAAVRDAQSRGALG